MPKPVASESPFPPLQPDRRYRGVYERAGFDVNLGGSAKLPLTNNIDRQTLYSDAAFQKARLKPKASELGLSMKTPMSAPSNYPSFQATPGYNKSTRPTERAQKSDLGPKVNTDPYAATQLTRKSPNASYSQNDNHSSEYSGSMLETPIQHLRSENDSNFTNPSLHLTTGQEQVHYQPFQPFQPFQPSHRKNERQQNPLGSEGQQEQGFNVEKNIKNLRLDIQHSNFSAGSDKVVHGPTPFDNHSNNTNSSEHSDHVLDNLHYEECNDVNIQRTRSIYSNHSAHSSTSVQTCELMPEQLHSLAPYPVKDYDQIYTPSSEKHLSSVLAEFKQDVEHHRNGDSNTLTPDYPASSHLSSDSKGYSLRSNFLVNSSHNLGEEFNSSKDDFSFGGNQRNLDETGITTAEDIPKMISEFSEKRDHAQNSHLSTISSILSKEDAPNHEEIEIERELERQLENLKSGSKLSLHTRHNESFTTAFDEPLGSHENSTSGSIMAGSECLGSRNGLISSSFGDLSIKEAITPLFARKNTERFELPSRPTTLIVDNSQVSHKCETPETIKPLSPRKHHLEHELLGLDIPPGEDLGKPFIELDRTFDSLLLGQENKHRDLNHVDMSVDEQEVEILASNVPQGFEAFPRSVIGPSIPCFGDNESKNSPGTGPCRSCHGVVSMNGKGSQRSIFSRSGELSGQWHRGCFLCSYNNCSVVFNKQVVPYVLLDNPFCYQHYHSLNDTLCNSCNHGIEGDCIENELKQKWHVDCLMCSHCSRSISDDYYCVNGEVFCANDVATILEERRMLGLLTTDKVEKRRTRLMFLEQGRML